MSLHPDFEPVWQGHPVGQLLADEVVFVALRVSRASDKTDDNEIFVATQLLMATCQKLTDWRNSLKPPVGFARLKK